MKNFWKIYRDHLRWHCWDDVVLPFLIVAVLLLSWRVATFAQGPTNTNGVSPRIQKTVIQGFVVYKPIGPTN